MAWDDDKLDQLFREQLPEAPKAPADEFQRIVQRLGVWARLEFFIDRSWFVFAATACAAVLLMLQLNQGQEADTMASWMDDVLIESTDVGSSIYLTDNSFD